MSTQATQDPEPENADSKNAEPKNKTIFFSHDTNAFWDPKIRHMVATFGITAYGIFWVIIEMLATQRNYKIKKEGFCEGLWPVVQGAPVSYASENGIGYFVNHLGEEASEAEMGRHEIHIDDLYQMVIKMVAIELLQDDGVFIWSDSLNYRMKIKENKAEVKKNAKSEAGKKSGEARRKKKEQKEAEQRQSEDGQDQEAEIK